MFKMMLPGTRSEELFREQKEYHHRRTDRMFAGLMIFQWIAAIVIALVVTPRTWTGQSSQTHFHVWASIFIGGTFTSLPVFLTLTHPGKSSTRHVVAAAQLLMSGLIIHLTGGRIETHFHIFGSLAFLACYRDWRVLMTASVIVTADHLIRGMYLPMSVYGVASAAPWRVLEHAGWVVFEDTFLFISIRQSLREMAAVAERQAKLEEATQSVERTVAERTHELMKEIAERREAEAKLNVAVRKAEDMNRTKTDFLSIAAHELRTPLTSIRGFSEILLTRKLSEDKQSRLLRTINEQSSHLSNLINDMLDLSRIENGNGLHLRYGSFDLVALSAEAARTFQKLSTKHRYILEAEGTSVAIADIDDDATYQSCKLRPLVVRCDGEKMRQVLQNLLSNSTKYSPNGGSVVVRLLTDDTRTTCEIIDQGKGMTPEQLSRIFEKFYRADVSNTAIEGTGLGMSIVKTIVEQHGGKINVASEAGRGTTVKFELLNAGNSRCTMRFVDFKQASMSAANAAAISN